MSTIFFTLFFIRYSYNEDNIVYMERMIYILFFVLAMFETNIFWIDLWRKSKSSLFDQIVLRRTLLNRRAKNWQRWQNTANMVNIHYISIYIIKDVKSYEIVSTLIPAIKNDWYNINRKEIIRQHFIKECDKNLF